MSNQSLRRRPLLAAVACCTTIVATHVGCAMAQDQGAMTPPATPPMDPAAMKSIAPPPANAPMQKVLDELAALNPKPIETLTPEEARKQPSIADAALALKKEMDMPAVTPPGIDSDDEEIDVKIDGKDVDVDVRVYKPEGTADNANLPVVLYIHGGGWVIATNDTYDASARSLSKLLNAVVVSPEYRKAPEHPFPAAHEDVYATLQWLATNAAQYGGDPNNIAVVGESAGGNMATAACLMARDRGGKMPVAQVLVYPLVSGATDQPSKMENFNAKPLNTPMLKWFSTKAIQDPSAMKSPFLFPLENADLKGLPPATVITAQIDPLRDEGKAYADKLKAAGVDVEYKNYDGVTHEFFGLADALTEAKDAQALAVSRLKKAMMK